MRKRIAAFTLVELLLALAITTILIVLLVNVVSAALNVWSQGMNQIDTNANARQAIGRMADEIKGATAAPSPRPVQFTENLDPLGGTTAPVAGTSENVFFVAPYPNAKAGDLCVFAYRHNSDTYTLERGFIDSEAAWKNASPSRYQFGGYGTSDWKWRTVADGVIQFEIRSYSQQDVDGAAEPSATPTQAAWDSTNTSPPMTGNTPRRVVIRMQVVDSKTLARLKSAPSASASLLRQAAREFTTEVTLPPPH